MISTSMLRFLGPRAQCATLPLRLLCYLAARSLTLLKASFAAALFGALCTSSAFAQVTQTRVAASDAGWLDQFGTSIAASGDLAVIGAPRKDGGPANTGAAYVFRLVGEEWIEEAILTAPDAGVHHLFGSAAATDGITVVVGAHQVATSGRGSVYVFEKQGEAWILEQQLTPSDAADGDIFGSAVAVGGDVLLVGAPFDDDACESDVMCQSGSVYVFRRTKTGWVEEAKLLASDAAKGDHFGFSLALDGDWAVVGARHDDDAGNNTGSVYVFHQTESAWVEDAKLNPSDPGSYDDFGTSLAISGDRVIVGAPNDDDDGLFSGSAYVFRRKGGKWVQEGKLTASDAKEAELFGWSVAISGAWALAGARVKDQPIDPFCCERAGGAYLFRDDGTGWSEYAKLAAPTPAHWDQYGYSVFADGSFGFVGTPERAFGAGDNAGSVYVLELAP